MSKFSGRGHLLPVIGLFLCFCAGCDNGGAPPTPPAGPRFSFTPAEESLTIHSAGYLDFQVTSEPQVNFNVAWSLDGQAIAVGRSLRFFPPDLGAMNLVARASYEDKSASQSWSLQVVNSHELNFLFHPPEDHLSLVQGQTQLFQITHQWPFAREFAWLHQGQTVSTDSTFVYRAETLGADTLQARVTAADTSLHRTWVFAISENRPEAVEQVLWRPGFEAGSIDMIWVGVAQLVDPIEGYDIAASDEGPITEDNWSEVHDLGRFDHLGEGSVHTVYFNPTTHGFAPGTEVWFAVRSVDANGILSSIATNLQIQLPQAWWIEGTVKNELGDPLAGILVNDENQQWQSTTNEDGEFRLGPYPEQRRISLRTHSPDEDQPGQTGSSWHDYRIQDLGMATNQPLDLRLLTRWGSDESCPSYQGSFLLYFKYITRTSVTTELRPDHRLFHWETYPLRVYLPEHQAQGIDYEAACRETMDIWNSTMGEDYFVAVTDPLLADVEFLFEDMGPEANGQTVLLEPHDLNYQLGDVVPQRMRVRINDFQSDLQRIQETSLHELGHVLGLNRHVLCNQPGYLMFVSAAGVLDDGPENAIHIDEQRAVRTIRYLPQGQDMAGY